MTKMGGSLIKRFTETRKSFNHEVDNSRSKHKISKKLILLQPLCYTRLLDYPEVISCNHHSSTYAAADGSAIT
jgi:hypothetical protein